MPVRTVLLRSGRGPATVFCGSVFRDGAVVLVAVKDEPFGRAKRVRDSALRAPASEAVAGTEEWLRRGRTKECPRGLQARKGSPVLSMALSVTSSFLATAMMATLAWPLRALTAR